MYHCDPVNNDFFSHLLFKYPFMTPSYQLECIIYALLLWLIFHFNFDKSNRMPFLLIGLSHKWVFKGIWSHCWPRPVDSVNNDFFQPLAFKYPFMTLSYQQECIILWWIHEHIYHVLFYRLDDLACMHKLFGRVTDGHKTIGKFWRL